MQTYLNILYSFLLVKLIYMWYFNLLFKFIYYLVFYIYFIFILIFNLYSHFKHCAKCKAPLKPRLIEVLYHIK